VAILDEPTSGLDPQAVHELLDLIRELSGDGMTILLSSHALDAVQSVCHRIALFNEGRIGFIGTPEELASSIGGGAFIVDVEADDIDLPAAIKPASGVKSVSASGEGRWQVEAERDIRPDIGRLVVQGGGSLRSMDLRRTRLDEAYNRYFREHGNET
ncbi:MAG: ABC transporter ATP-binding protein, partial [Salaquimonas sp.]|nr:ABC transporter ATP-binding protein [Salaquimonas sp.]